MTCPERRIAQFKRDARRAYETFQSYDYDCGNSILKMVSTGAGEAALKFNAAIAELKLIDPDCPDIEPL